MKLRKAKRFNTIESYANCVCLFTSCSCSCSCGSNQTESATSFSGNFAYDSNMNTYSYQNMYTGN